MKKLVVLLMILALTLLVAATTLAAVHNYTDDFINHFLMSDYNNCSMANSDYSKYGMSKSDFENWYYVEKDDPEIKFQSAFSNDSSYYNYNRIGFEYLQNEQNFFNLTSIDDDYQSELYLKGSYLFDNGFFTGLDIGGINYDAHDIDDESQITFSPGYRINLPNESGYIAASADLAVTGDCYRDSGIIDYEINAKYSNKQSRIYGQIIIPDENTVGTDNTYVKLGGAFKISDNFVLGGNYSKGTLYTGFYQSNFKFLEYDLGFTASFDNFGAELQYKVFNNIDYYNEELYTIRMNLLYFLTNNCRAGFEVRKAENIADLYLTAKLKYLIYGQNAIIAMHTFKNDSGSEGAVSYIGCDIRL
ncbi:MAG: hypothetical protein PVG90_11855 [Bacillota bacterium]|jgi:hypothetical protein